MSEQYDMMARSTGAALVLPGTAQDDGELAGTWEDLPVASFAEAGTNVPTVLLKMKAQANA